MVAAVPAQAAEWTFTCGNPAPYQYQSATWSTGTPDRCMWAEMQALARSGGYTGPLDGVMGTNSWRGWQTVMRDWYGANPGTIDGVPGPNTYKAMQKIASYHGYTGPIDGVMGPNSWKHFSAQIQVYYYGP